MLISVEGGPILFNVHYLNSKGKHQFKSLATTSLDITNIEHVLLSNKIMFNIFQGSCASVLHLFFFSSDIQFFFFCFNIRCF